MKYFLLCCLLIVQLKTLGQKHIEGVFGLNKPYFFVTVDFIKGDSCIYHVNTETAGMGAFHSTYSIRNGHIHINIAPPPDTQKARVFFKGDNTSDRIVKVMDCDSVTYIGASVVLNGQFKYVLDATAAIKLPPGFVIKTLEISSAGRPDTTINVSDPGKGYAIATIPYQYMIATIYYVIVTDWYLKRTWLFGGRRLYAVRKGIVLKDYYLKRIR